MGEKCHAFLIMTSTKATVFSQCPGALQRNGLDKPAAANERHCASTRALEQAGTLLSSTSGGFGWHLLGTNPIMTCQSPYTKALVPSVNHLPSDSSMNILSGMAFSHANTPNAANKAMRLERERDTTMLLQSIKRK